jgi:xylulokinase
MAYLLGIDIGTSGIKAGIFSDQGKFTAFSKAASYSVDTPYPGWAESDPNEWKKSLVSALNTLKELNPAEFAEIGCVGITSFYPVVIPIEETGTSLYPAILYCDGRGQNIIDKILKEAGKDFFQITGNRLSAGNTGAVGMAWIKHNRPEIYEKTACFAFANTYIVNYLTGSFVTDPSTASLSGLTTREDTKNWDPLLLRLFGLDINKLPSIIDSSQRAGDVTETASRDTGLPTGIPVFPGCGDTPAAAFGSGASDSGTAVDVSGSSDSILLPVPSPAEDNRLVNSAFPGPPWRGAIGTVTSSGASVAWFIREFLSGNRKQFLELISGKTRGSTVIFLPYLQGERTPHWNSRASGSFFGLTAGTRLEDTAKAVLCGTAMALKDTVSVLEEFRGETIGEIRITGGGTAIAEWNRIKAEFLERPILVVDFPHTGILGAAMLAGAGSGIISGTGEASGRIRENLNTKLIEPTGKNRGYYRDLYGQYRELYRQGKDIMENLSRIAEQYSG